MKQNYFVVNGVKYYTGTVFVTENSRRQLVEATFIWYDTEYKRYLYKTKERMHQLLYDDFWKYFVAVTNKRDDSVRSPVTRSKNDFEISGLFIGWVWYVFLMAISFIFKNAIGFWILISVIFFSWRAKKIKEEGTYVEW